MLRDVEVADLISKYLLNRLTNNERLKLEQWIQASTVNREKFEELTNIELLMEKAAVFLGREKEKASPNPLTIKVAR